MIIYTLIILGIVVLDQLVKWWSLSSLKEMGTLPIIQDVFHLTYAENTGAAFSILAGKQTFLIAITSVAMIVMFAYLMKWSKNPGEFWAKIAFAMMIGGGIGNLIDRVRFGFVVDMFDARIINFAIFNIADSFVSVGVALFVLSEFVINRKTARQ